MDREEVIRGLKTILDTEELARAICHDAFDAFVTVMGAKYMLPSDIHTGWVFFRLGWEAER